MSKATESRIPLSVERRKELAVVKAKRGHPNYDVTLGELIEHFDPDGAE